MLNRLEGKVIIIVGAGGVGGELARRYTDEGASVLLGDIDGALAAAAAAEIVAAGGKAIGVHLDGTDDASTKAAVDLAVSTYGGVDGFHANFVSYRDGQHGGDILELPMDIYDEVMRINARGFVTCTRHAVPALIARGGGTILYTSSGAAFMGMTTRAAYSMSKAAGHALMRHVATRWGPDGIRANVVSPGVIRHAAFDASVSDERSNKLREGIPLNRFGKPADIAAISALLMSDEGNFISGQVISIDGGGSMRQ